MSIQKYFTISIVGVIIWSLVFSAGYATSLKTFDSISVNVDKIHLDFSFSEPKIEEIHGETSVYHRVTLDSLPNTNDLHKPRLPVQSVKVLLPLGRDVASVSVSYDEQYHLGSNYHVETGQPLPPVNKETPLSEKNTNTICSSHLNFYSIVGTYKCRGYPILFINLYPVTYDGVTGDLFYTPHLTLEVYTKESEMKTPVRGLERDKRLIESIVDNPTYLTTYNAVKSSCTDTINYIIITNEELANSGLEDNFQYLLQSKIDKGLSAAIYTVEEIINNPEYSVNGTWGDNNPDNPFYESEITENYQLFNDTQAKIRNFIRYAHMMLGVDYVLLGGDADVDDEDENIIPVRGLFANESGLPLFTSSLILDEEEADLPSDVYYACLNGNFNYDEDSHFGECADRNDVADVDEADLLSEVYVGRACVDSDEEVAYFVMKTLHYEASDEEPYLKKVLMVGEYLGFPGISAYGGNYKDLVIPLIPENYNVETLYDRDLPNHWTKYDIMEILNNATPHIINHDGHSYYGYNLKMINKDVDSLMNTDYFFIYSHGCMAGGFDNPDGYDCIAEHYTVETPCGAFAVIMNARYGLGSENNLDSPSLALDKSFFKALFTENLRELGRANHYSKEDNIWHIDENGIRWVYYETNLLGDPELAIKDPEPLHIDLFVNFTQPENDGVVYFFNNKIFYLPFLTMPLIIGKFTVQVNASSNPEGYVYAVEFLLDNISQFIDQEPPYEWELNTQLWGQHTLTAVAHGIYGEKAEDTISFYALIPK